MGSSTVLISPFMHRTPQKTTSGKGMFRNKDLSRKRRDCNLPGTRERSMIERALADERGPTERGELLAVELGKYQ
jgi:hypothetical protein